jgi:hypothetical protein
LTTAAFRRALRQGQHAFVVNSVPIAATNHGRDTQPIDLDYRQIEP